MANSKPIKVVRSSITGRFVEPRKAVTSPKITQTETIRRRK